MAKVVTEQQINTFVRGLITEASPLTFPENSALDLSNVVFNRDGTISRRLGIDYEDGYVEVPLGISGTALANASISTHEWSFPGGSTTTSIQVVRINNQLWFFDTLVGSISANVLNAGVPITLPAVTLNDVDVDVINGYLVIVSEDLDKPVLLTYDTALQTVSQQEITIEIRDIFGVESENDIYERPTALSYKHAYNLVNQGWSERVPLYNGRTIAYYNLVGTTLYTPVKDDDGNVLTTTHQISTPYVNTAIDSTYQALGYYPSSSDIWFLGKIGNSASADFNAYSGEEMVKSSVYFAQVPKGRYIINAFQRGASRATVHAEHSLLQAFTQPAYNSSLVTDEETGRLSTVATYAGRTFYSGVVSNVTDGDAQSPNYSGYVFFSQLAINKDQLGKCYQEADPTSEEINELVDTDGGTIQIPEATRIFKLFPAGQSLIVFADNGVWEIYGDGGFKATSFQLSKVSSTGMRSPNTIVDASGTIIYWSKSGIQALIQDTVSGRYVPQSLSLSTIQSFYNEISDLAKQNAVGFFDEKENQVRWLYSDAADYDGITFINRYNKELVLDLTLQSFYVNQIDRSLGNYPFVAGYVKTSGTLYESSDEAVVVFDDPVVVNADPVILDELLPLTSAGQYKYLTFTDSGGGGALAVTFSAYNSFSFLDWFTYDSVGTDYSSYLVTGYQLYEDWMRAKQAPYLFMYFDRTEDGYELVGGNLVHTNQSSCFVQSQWDWADSVNSGKWGTAFQAYRLLRNYIPSGPADTFDYGHRVIVTKNKLRGRGKALSLKFYSETGKDFRLHGWALVVTGNSTP